MKPTKRTWLAILVIVAVVTGLLIFFMSRPQSPNSEKSGSAKSYSTKGQPKSNRSISSSEKSYTSSATTNRVLLAPSGDFVSNHRPNLSGYPAPSSISSVCNTTSGAECKISFTKGNETKELSSKTADANGTVYWSWRLQDVGLTAGSWKVEATASLNGQSKTASDAMDLQVEQ